MKTAEPATDFLQIKDLTLQEFGRLEKLGDAVLRLVVVEKFYIEQKPVDITHGKTIRYQTNAYMEVTAKAMGIEPHPKDISTYRYANALEAKIGHLYIEYGIDEARALISQYISVFKSEI